MSLSETEIKHIAKLARLELTDDELKTLGEQLASILEYVEKIQGLKLPEDAAQMAHGAGLTNVFREDQAQNCTEDSKKLLLESFPSRDGDLLCVKSVFENRNTQE